MRRKITVTLIIIVCFLLQSTLFKALSFASISPNLLIVVCASFGFMRGRKEGIFIGFFSGLLIDIFFGEMIGFYALLYMYAGFLNGCFKKMFYPDDIKLPMLLIAGSDLSYNLFPVFIPQAVCNWILYVTHYHTGTCIHAFDFCSFIFHYFEN